MQIPIFLVSVVLGVIIFNVKLHNASSKNDKEFTDFFESEKCNVIKPKSSLVDISYIDVPNDINRIKNLDKKFINSVNSINEMCSLKMTKFNMKNIDIKKTYGINNFDEAISYQTNYETFIETIANTGESLFKFGDIYNSKVILELGVKINSDITKNYTYLADIYIKEKDSTSLFELIDFVKSNKNLSQKKIISYIESSVKSNSIANNGGIL